MQWCICRIILCLWSEFHLSGVVVVNMFLGFLCVWPDPVLLIVHLLSMNSNSGISKWWRSRHVEGLLRPKGICCCFSKLSWCPSKRPCLSSAGLMILNLFTFYIFGQLQISPDPYIGIWTFLDGFHRWLPMVVWLKVVGMQAEAAFSAKDFMRAASFYAKVDVHMCLAMLHGLFIQHMLLICL